MSNYTASYQAPYRYNSITTYEPDGSSTQDGSNLTDYATFCTDCHNTTYTTIYSTPLGRYLRTIDWINEKHGKGAADVGINIDAPYSSTLGKVTACTDCHEPHGAPNKVLIRQEVNGAVLAETITTIAPSSASAPAPGPGNDNVESGYLCHRCHYVDNTKADNCYIHHTSSDAPYPGPPMGCTNCHYSKSGMGGCSASATKISCNNCHFHGSTDVISEIR